MLESATQIERENGIRRPILQNAVIALGFLVFGCFQLPNVTMFLVFLAMSYVIHFLGGVASEQIRQQFIMQDILRDVTQIAFRVSPVGLDKVDATRIGLNQIRQDIVSSFNADDSGELGGLASNSYLAMLRGKYFDLQSSYMKSQDKDSPQRAVNATLTDAEKHWFLYDSETSLIGLL